MAPRLTLLPSRFERTIPDTAKSSVIVVSATSSGVRLGNGTPFGRELGAYPGGMTIFTERLDVNVSGDGTPSFSTRGCPLTLSTDNITVASNDRPAIISTQGASAAVSTANTGKDAGILNICVRSAAPALEKALELDAQGGLGGSPSATSSETGGNGGKGGTVTVIVRPRLADVQTPLTNILKELKLPRRWTARDELAASTLTDGHPLLLATAQVLADIKGATILPESELNAYIEPIEALLKLRIAPGTEPKDKESGEPIRSVYRLGAALNEAITLSQDAIDESRIELSSRIECRGGLAGKRGDLGVDRGERGKDGGSGSWAVEFLGPNNPFRVLDIPFVFAHPLQCKMVLDKANVYYYLGSQANRIKARHLLQSLLNRLSFATSDFVDAFQGEQNLTPLVKAFIAFWGSSAEAKKQVSDLRSIHKKAGQLYIRLEATDVDYYGYPSAYVPRVSDEEVKKLLESALTGLNRAETTYLTYFSEKQDATKLEANKTTAAVRMDEAIQRSNEDLKQLNGLVVKKYNEVRDAKKNDAILAARNEAELAMSKLTKAVNSKFAISPKSFLTGLASFASEPGLSSGAKAGASLIYEGFTTVPNLDGEPVDKDVLIKQLKKGTGDVASLKAEMLALPFNADGTLPTDPENMTKVMTTLEAVNALLQDFAQDAFGSSAPQCKEALQEYSDLLVKRNTEIVEFNVMLKTVVNAKESIANLEVKKLQLEQGRLNTDSNSVDDLDSMTKLLEFVLDNARQRCMRLLSFLQRALRYKTLSMVDFQDQAWNEQMRIQPESEEAALSMTSPILREMTTSLADQLFAVQELAAGDRSLFPSEFSQGGIGKVHRLSEAELQELLKTSSTTVNVPAIDNGTKNNATSEFSGNADVRIYRVRFWLRGLKLVNGRAALGPSSKKRSRDDRTFTGKLVTTTLTHSGTEVIYDTSGKRYTFQHEPIPVTFSYRLDEEGNYSIDDASGGDIVNFSSQKRGTNSIYAAPSPFTRWKISLKYANTQEIDFSGVKEAVIEFLGSNRAFVGDQ